MAEDQSVAPDNIKPFTTPPPRTSSGGNGGNYIDVVQRLTAIETQMKFMAKREDVSEIKSLIERKEATLLKWMMSILVASGVAIVAAVIRSFL